MVTTNQKSIIETHTQKKKKSIHNTKDSHQITREENKRRRKGNKRATKKKHNKTINKMLIRIYISIITLNINGQNAPVKRHRVAEWIQKEDLYICCLRETHFISKDTVRGWKKIFHANGNQKKGRVK